MSPDLDGFHYTLILMYIYKKKKNYIVTNSINFSGIYILASVRCAFPKIRSRKTIKKNKKKSLTPQLWRRSSHTGRWVSGGETVMNFLERGATPWSLFLPFRRRASTKSVVQVVLKKRPSAVRPLPSLSPSFPSASDRSSSSPDRKAS